MSATTACRLTIKIKRSIVHVQLEKIFECQSGDSWKQFEYFYEIGTVSALFHCPYTFKHHTIRTFFLAGATKVLNKKIIVAFNIQHCRSSPIFMQFGPGAFKIFAMKQAPAVFWGLTL